MKKIVVILFLVFFITSCSAVKNETPSQTIDKIDNNDVYKLLDLYDISYDKSVISPCVNSDVSTFVNFDQKPSLVKVDMNQRKVFIFDFLSENEIFKNRKVAFINENNCSRVSFTSYDKVDDYTFISNESLHVNLADGASLSDPSFEKREISPYIRTNFPTFLKKDQFLDKNYLIVGDNNYVDTFIKKGDFYHIYQTHDKTMSIIKQFLYSRVNHTGDVVYNGLDKNGFIQIYFNHETFYFKFVPSAHLFYVTI